MFAINSFKQYWFETSNCQFWAKWKSFMVSYSYFWCFSIISVIYWLIFSRYTFHVVKSRKTLQSYEKIVKIYGVKMRLFGEIENNQQAYLRNRTGKYQNHFWPIWFNFRWGSWWNILEQVTKWILGVIKNKSKNIFYAFRLAFQLIKKICDA